MSLLTFLSMVLFQITGRSAEKVTRNVLLLNSYHQGYAWTDSLTRGVIRKARLYPETNLYIKNLDAKKFGQENFDIEKEHLKGKYKNIPFDGVVVTDNDALDFALRYKHELFPNAQIVFAGISNPEDYPLESKDLYGFEENIDFESNVDLVRQILPGARHLLVITDNTTTGKILRKKMDELQRKLEDFSITYSKFITQDSICALCADTRFDAIFYFTISQDQNGAIVDNEFLFKKIRKVAQVPVFYDDITFLGKGNIGGAYQNGAVQGGEALALLEKLMALEDRSSIRRVNSSGQQYFFDQKELNRFGISKERLPAGALVGNKKEHLSRSNYMILLGILTFLSLIVVVLIVVNRRQKILHIKSNKQLEQIEMQRNELQVAYKKVSDVISELEEANARLNISNIDLQDAKKKAEEADKLKSAFLANVSHEIRTPLNSIVGFSSLLNDEGLDDETRKSYIELIESNTESLLVLIDEIIDLSKIEAQQLSIKKQFFSVDSLITELFQIFKLNRNNPAIELVAKNISTKQELIIYSDRVRVRQIFINLLSNSFKFTDSGRIEFGYFAGSGGEIVLFVKDTGIGIKEEYHQAVFQRFRKLHENQDKKIYRGTGLGLAITQKLVELLGGKI